MPAAPTRASQAYRRTSSERSGARTRSVRRSAAPHARTIAGREPDRLLRRAERQEGPGSQETQVRGQMRARVRSQSEADRQRPPPRREARASAPPETVPAQTGTRMTSGIGELLTLAAYYAVLTLLAVYGAHRVFMLRLYYRHRADVPRPAGELASLPRVTVQLPIYNEVYVVERLVEAVAAIDYPRDLLEIQILDDSTDETRERRPGHRGAASRAGARRSPTGGGRHRDRFQGRRPPGGARGGRGRVHPDLRRRLRARGPTCSAACLPHFADPSVGMVQARWDHLNRDYSLLTKIQSIFLDGHFVIEHTARNRSGRFFNFNGTAGIWRRATMEDAGGWQSDTLTEDLDLRIAPAAGLAVRVSAGLSSLPAEVPVDINGFKSQQHRWTQGSIQTGRSSCPRSSAAAFPGR